MKKHIKPVIDLVQEKEQVLKPWQIKVQEVIYGTKTPAGKLFDILLLFIILFSIIIIMLESVDYLNVKYKNYFLIIEYIVTGLFTIEYFLRVFSLKKPFKYIFSFMGVVDLLSILPTYLSLFIAGTKPITVIRAIRFLRVFHILEMNAYLRGSGTIIKALISSRHKIIVFVISLIVIVTVLGAIMYSIESSEAGFTSIPRSIYWAIITITTVGYGDIAPVTPMGQAIASIIMLIGYSIIAVPTGIVSAEIATQKTKNKYKLFNCHSCKGTGHSVDAEYCKYCGEHLEKKKKDT